MPSWTGRGDLGQKSSLAFDSKAHPLICELSRLGIGLW